MFRKSKEIEDLNALNDEAIKTAHDNTFSEKKYNAWIKKLKDELKDLKKEYDHRERCYKKVHDENDELRAENSKLQKLVSGQKVEEMKKLQTSNDEKDRQIKLLKEMIRGVKGELKVRDVDIDRL